jgi:hypothetical protein
MVNAPDYRLRCGRRGRYTSGSACWSDGISIGALLGFVQLNPHPTEESTQDSFLVKTRFCREFSVSDPSNREQVREQFREAIQSYVDAVRAETDQRLTGVERRVLVHCLAEQIGVRFLNLLFDESRFSWSDHASHIGWNEPHSLKDAVGILTPYGLARRAATRDVPMYAVSDARQTCPADPQVKQRIEQLGSEGALYGEASDGKLVVDPISWTTGIVSPAGVLAT